MSRIDEVNAKTLEIVKRELQNYKLFPSRCGYSKSDILLKELANALDNAYISSWQSTNAWQKELDTALEYLKELESTHE